MKTAIICSGSMNNYDYFHDLLHASNYIICADGGTRHAYAMKVKPDLIIGDMDSSSCDYIKYYKSQGVKVITFPCDKDKTDTQICMEYALKFSSSIVILGATGNRIDHMLANISLLKMAADRGIDAAIIDEYNEIHLVTRSISLKGKKNEIISLIPLSERVEGVSITGVGYELHGATMELGNPYGVSNYFVEEEIKIDIEKGYLLAIKSKDKC